MKLCGEMTPSRKYDLVICDIDGCLSPESSAPIHIEKLVEVARFNELAKSQQDRPLVTVCSGRPAPFCEAMCRLLQNDQLPCIGENGVWMFNPVDNSYEMDPAITPEHLEIVHSTRAWVMNRYGKHGVTLQPGKSASVTLYHPEPEYLQSIIPELRAEAEASDWPFRISMTWFYINCDLKFVSKASGINRLLAASGVAAERTAGIGDTMSDKSIAETVSWFACPANAQDEIKTYADYVSPYEQIEGVLDILQQLK